MQQIEILLKKRHRKFVIYLFVALFCGSLGIGLLGMSSFINLITDFDWFTVAAGAVILICLFAAIKGLVPYFTYGNVWLVVESDGQTIRFFNKSTAGKVFNQSEDIGLLPIKSFYVVKRSTRFFIKNYSFGYTTGGFLGSAEIFAFPSLFEATAVERQAVLNFVKKARPEIELGYENFFQKLAKR